ncbi:MAG: type transport system ATP-binding protein [Blastocatellia bacterium]|jgi:ABC-2 type transport system ATP-binding protein|nr:type transport system ATP-binding protein [Blastocatellia bacterium]
MTLTEPPDTIALSQKPERKSVVSIDHISKTYPVSFLRLKKLFRKRFKPPVEALRDVSFDIREGEIFGLIGPNGAGKTTLTKIIATLVQPTLGSVTVKGYDSVRNDEEVRRQVGLATAEERSFYWRLSAEENLVFFARLYGLSEIAASKRIRELMERFELQDLARRRFGELSTGNKQRLAVARAMLANPPVLLLDEPTRSLDPLAAARMRSLIKSLTTEGSRVTVLLTSHNLLEVEELCERVAIIGGGSILALDSPKKLRQFHNESEHIKITFVSADGNAVGSGLHNEELQFELSNTDRDDEWVVSLTRKAGDETLDQVLRFLHDHNALIRSIDTERATLFDVLESYEKEKDATNSQDS